ncbi:hypothetical protein E1288_05305 [Saccharopolyspora elongata]|uniref:Uncharacterized protein n=2 Tax=Saccharopolyspora elongata TaxID=2530387 RepID=A0A4R4ZBK4_9PSEU|nr:hypothetical protein E1288_05305 [Saccharopolyspora elongata]
MLVVLIAGFVGGYAFGTFRESAEVSEPPVSVPAPPPLERERVPCAAAADVGRALLAQTQRAAEAIGQLDPHALRQVLDEYERLQARLEQAIAACSG